MNSACPPQLRIVVLAAGLSRRLGRPKALASVRGRTMLRRTVAVLAPFAGSSRVIVIAPPAASRYRVECRGCAVAWVANRRRRTGLSSSVRLGIARARYSAAALLVPVDLVELTRRDVARLIGRWHGTRRRVVGRRVSAGGGVPLILPRWLYPRCAELQGDHGMREVVGRLPAEAVCWIALPSARSDVDTRADLQRARRRRKP